MGSASSEEPQRPASRYKGKPVDTSRPPTEKELEQCRDYSTVALLPPLPEVAPIHNKLAYKGYMLLKVRGGESSLPFPLVSGQGYFPATKKAGKLPCHFHL